MSMLTNWRVKLVHPPVCGSWNKKEPEKRVPNKGR